MPSWAINSTPIILTQAHIPTTEAISAIVPEKTKQDFYKYSIVVDQYLATFNSEADFNRHINYHIANKENFIICETPNNIDLVEIRHGYNDGNDYNLSDVIGKCGSLIIKMPRSLTYLQARL